MDSTLWASYQLNATFWLKVDDFVSTVALGSSGPGSSIQVSGIRCISPSRISFMFGEAVTGFMSRSLDSYRSSHVVFMWNSTMPTRAQIVDDLTITCDVPLLNFNACVHRNLLFQVLIFQNAIPGSVPLSFDSSVECAETAIIDPANWRMLSLIFVLRYTAYCNDACLCNVCMHA